jgi:histone acetyltransferase
VHPGLTCFKDGVHKIPVELIPGIQETGWEPPAHDKSRSTRTSDRAGQEHLTNAIKTIFNACRNHKSSWPFLIPVDRKEVPDYHEHVMFPMDMKTMAERFKMNYYDNRQRFIADMKRMFTNCRAFYAPETKYYNCANVLERFFTKKCRDHGIMQSMD